jgi:hypothetical protein
MSFTPSRGPPCALLVSIATPIPLQIKQQPRLGCARPKPGLLRDRASIAKKNTIPRRSLCRTDEQHLDLFGAQRCVELADATA